jgi:hypothetical protein
MNDIKEDPVVKEFASVKTENPELYNLMAKTNPTLKFLVDVSDAIVNNEEVHA